MYRLTGFQSPAEEYARPPLSLDSQFLKRPLSTFFVRFTSDAMESECIHDGDLLVVERVLHFPPNSLVLAFVNGQRVVRRLIQRTGNFYLSAPDHRDIPITDSVELFGLVICAITCFPKRKVEAQAAV